MDLKLEVRPIKIGPKYEAMIALGQIASLIQGYIIIYWLCLFVWQEVHMQACVQNHARIISVYLEMSRERHTVT